MAEIDWVYGRYNELVNGGYFMVYKPTIVRYRVISPIFCAGEIGVINAASQNINQLYIIEGNLEVKLPTIWTDEKQSREEAERRERLEERRVEEKE